MDIRPTTMIHSRWKADTAYSARCRQGREARPVLHLQTTATNTALRGLGSSMQVGTSHSPRACIPHTCHVVRSYPSSLISDPSSFGVLGHISSGVRALPHAPSRWGDGRQTMLTGSDANLFRSIIRVAVSQGMLQIRFAPASVGGNLRPLTLFPSRCAQHKTARAVVACSSTASAEWDSSSNRRQQHGGWRSSGDLDWRPRLGYLTVRVSRSSVTLSRSSVTLSYSPARHTEYVYVHLH